MIDVLSREGIYLWFYFSVQLEQIFKYWVIGILLGSAISVFGKKKIHQLFGNVRQQKSGILGILLASLLGIASPLCMYGTIPIAASFSEKGMKEDVLAAFMMSSILLNPQLILYSAALGTTALASRVVACLLCGMTAGFSVRFLFMERGKRFFSFSGLVEAADRDTDPNLFMRFLKSLWRNLKTTGPYFLIGVMLSAVSQRYIPDTFWLKAFGNNNPFGILMAATIGVPLYACGGGTIPLLREWLASGMGMGSAIAFMITGPATKITNLGALKIVLGGKRFLQYLLFVFFAAVLSGFVADALM